MSFCLTHFRLPETRDYMSNTAQCLARFKCHIKVGCSHGIHLPVNKGRPLTAMNFAPCFHRQLPLCLLTSELCLDSAPKCSLGSDWNWVAHMHICQGCLVPRRETSVFRARKQDWWSTSPLWAQEIIEHITLVQWPSAWRTEGKVSQFLQHP